jgi:hypothetical protein
MLHRAILRMTLRTTLAVASACAAVLVLPGCDDASTPKAEYTVSIVSPGLGDVLFPNREIAFRAELSGLPDDVDPASIRFDWRFGDGQEIVGGGEEVSHAYIAPGTWSVSVAARQTEGDKTGSVARASETFTTSPPADLIPRSPAVLLSAANLTSSDTFRVSFDLENLAAPTLLPFEVAIYALDADVDAPADIAALQTLVTARQAFIVADRTLQPMPSAPARQNIDFENLRMPASAPTGTYRVLAVADSNDRIGEDNESDNAQFGDRGFAFANTESRGPNLRVRDVTVRPPRANELSNLIIDAVVYNVGSQPALLFDFDVWLSRDPQWDEGDRLLAQDRIASVPANAIQEVEGLAITLDPPVTELGEYFVIVRADSDNDVEEILETDNVAASGVVTVTDEQLPGADIAVSQVQVAPLNTFLDGSIEVRRMPGQRTSRCSSSAGSTSLATTSSRRATTRCSTRSRSRRSRPERPQTCCATPPSPASSTRAATSSSSTAIRTSRSPSQTTATTSHVPRRPSKSQVRRASTCASSRSR